MLTLFPGFKPASVVLAKVWGIMVTVNPSLLTALTGQADTVYGH